jgi:hypothetical protein
MRAGPLTWASRPVPKRGSFTLLRRGTLAGMDPDPPGLAEPGPAHGGLEPAVAVGGDEPAGQVLSQLRQAGAWLAVILDADDYPQAVVPEKTLAAAPAGQKVATCKPAWPAAAFLQPASAQDARRLAAHNQSQPWLGHRTVVVENGQIAGVVPIPALIDRPGPTSRVLEWLLWNTGLLTARVRYGRISRRPRPRPPRQSPSGSP